MNGPDASGPSPFEARRRGEHLRVTGTDKRSRMRGKAKDSELNQLPLRQVLHQRADAEGPGLALVAGAHAVDELAELGR